MAVHRVAEKGRSYFAKIKNAPKESRQTLAFVLAAALAYCLRGSQYILQPQLYAEDGATWLADGFNTGLRSLASPYNGFFHTFERLFGLLVAQWPLQFAPAIFSLTALLLFCLMVYYLFSTRTRILANTYERVFMLLAICLIANVDEFFFNFSNSIFLLGISGVLIIVAQKPENRIVNVLEKAVFALSCFTLPFAWFYLPILLVERFKHHKKTPFFLYVAVAGSMAQLAAYLLSQTERSSVTLWSLFSKFTLLEIYNQIIIPALRFARIDSGYRGGDHFALLSIGLIIAACLAMTIIVLKKSDKHVWYLIFFLFAMTAASLKSPLVGHNVGAYRTLKIMSTTPWGDRYFIFGILAAMLIMVKFTYLLIAPRFRYAFIAIFMALGLVASLQFHSLMINRQLADLRGQYYSNIRLLQSHSTDSISIPVNPSGWSIELRRKKT